MDSDEVNEDRPRRRRRRRRRHSTEEDVAPPVEPLRLGALIRELAGLGVFGIFFLLIVVAPIPMGANRDWAWSPLIVVIGVLALLCAAGIGGRQGFKVSPEESTSLLVLIGCFLLFVVVALVQMSPLAPLTPSAPFYAKAGELLGQSLVAVPTLAVDATREALLKCFGCAALFMMARVLFHDQRWARLLVMIFLLSAVIVVTYALYMSVTTHSRSSLSRRGGCPSNRSPSAATKAMPQKHPKLLLPTNVPDARQRSVAKLYCPIFFR